MKLRRHILSIVIAAIATSAAAQYSNTLYFMDEISERNAMNPAFLPRCQSYFDFILLPNFYIGGGETMFALRDLNNIDNLTQKILSSGKDGREFSSFHLNIVNFGVAVGLDQYFIFESGINFEEVITVPNDVFRLALEGMPDPNATYNYSLNSFNSEINAYTYFGAGYSGRLSDMVTFGIKAKALFGMANMQTNVYNLQLQTSRDNWTLMSQAYANLAIAYPLVFSHKEGGGIAVTQGELPSSKIPYFNYVKAAKPAGYGAALDLGITIEPIENLVISAAVTDLGIMHWYQNSMTKFSLNTNVEFDGIIDYSINDTSDIGNQATKKLNSLKDQIVDSIKIGTADPYNSMLYGKFIAGIEYGILKNKISFGLMNRMTFNNKKVYDEVTLAVNFRPCAYVKAALSYSFVNGNWGTLGLGLNLNLGPVCMYLISDYVPITWATVTSEEKNINMPLPDRLKRFNVQAGMSFNLDRFDHDNDRDGVPNRYDICPDQSIEYLRKQYPKLKLKQFTDKSGCIPDEDKDGVSDYTDLCPNTPSGAVVDSVGCPIDSDGDSVPDYMDDCPETPSGVAVDKSGCPKDEDKDGVPDYLDHCPGTPRNVIVDTTGCPMDGDGDGVPDYLDRCQDTPEGVSVDKNGCPIDTDGDGVPDFMDNCPEVAGVAENNGCPKEPEPVKEPTEEVRNVFRKAMQGIQFETAKATIKPVSFPILNQIVAILEMDTTYRLEIAGHTDNQGDHDKNMKLSQDRAQAVVDYLINHGISADRLKAVGYGPDRPIADNSTKQGRTENRRVEFNLVYETVTFKTKDVE